jgi:hypothetical protein
LTSPEHSSMCCAEKFTIEIAYCGDSECYEIEWCSNFPGQFWPDEPVLGGRMTVGAAQDIELAIRSVLVGHKREIARQVRRASRPGRRR